MYCIPVTLCAEGWDATGCRMICGCWAGWGRNWGAAAAWVKVVVCGWNCCCCCCGACWNEGWFCVKVCCCCCWGTNCCCCCCWNCCCGAGRRWVGRPLVLPKMLLKAPEMPEKKPGCPCTVRKNLFLNLLLKIKKLQIKYLKFKKCPWHSFLLLFLTTYCLSL